MLNRLIYFYNMDVFGQNKSQTNTTIPTENWTSVSSFTSFYTNQSISHSQTHTWRLSCTRHGIFSLNARFKLQNVHNCFKYLRNNSNTLILIQHINESRTYVKEDISRSFIYVSYYHTLIITGCLMFYMSKINTARFNKLLFSVLRYTLQFDGFK